MASFCTKCGAGINPDSEFCPMCGSPKTASAPAPDPINPSAYVAPPAPPQQGWQTPAQPMAYPAAPVQAASGNSAVKVILIIVGVFVALGAIGACLFAFTVWRVSRAVHVDSQSGKVTLNTPSGSFSANGTDTYTAAELGTDPYPGAKTGQGGMRLDLPTGSMVTAVFLTPDSKEKVVNYYKSKMGSEVMSMDAADTAVLTMRKNDKEAIVVTIDASGSHTDGMTKITVSHTKSSKAS